MINRITDELLVAAGRRHAGPVDPAAAPLSRQEEESISNQVKHWATEAEKFIATHPGASLAAALGIGVVLAWWVKRT